MADSGEPVKLTALGYTGRYAMAGVLASLPIAFSPDMDRGVEIAKLALLFPLIWLGLVGALFYKWGEDNNLGARASGVARMAKLALIAFAIAIVLSTLQAADTWRAVMGLHEHNEGMLVWLGCIGAFFVGSFCVRHEQSVDVWVDILLIASVAPCIYALLQGLGLTFYFNPLAIATRPSGSLGNPVYLAAYLGLLLPIGYARVWQAWHSNRRLAVVLCAVVLLLLTMLVWTLTRGPLLAGVVAAAIFGVVAAARSGARRGFSLSLAALLVGMSLLVAINLHPQLRELASQTRFLERMVLTFGPDVDRGAGSASLSAAIRVAFWHAGTEAFLAASPTQQWIGFGANSAWPHFYPYLSPLLMQFGGFREELVVDRIESESLEMLLAFGVVGWLLYVAFFSSVVFCGVRHLFGLRGKVWAVRFAVCGLTAALLAAVIARAVGLPAAMVPAFGTGLGLGWCLFIVMLSARWLQTGSVLEQGKEATLQLGLVCALIAFWLAAQVSGPVTTTRVIMFFLCACIVVLSDRAHNTLRKAAPPVINPLAHGPGAPRELTLAIGLALVAAAASFFPLTDDAGIFPKNIGLRLLPIGATQLVGLGVLLFGYHFSSLGRRWWEGATWRWCIWFALPVLFLCMQRGFVADTSNVNHVDDLIIPVASGSLFAALFVVLTCLLAGGWRARADTLATDARHTPHTQGRGRTACVAIVVSTGLVCLFAGLWRLMAADISDFASRWQLLAAKPELTASFRREAVRLLPQEDVYVKRLYRLVFAEMEGQIIAGATQLDAASRSLDRIQPFLGNLSRRFPNDPWVTRDLAKWSVVKGALDKRRGDEQFAISAFDEAQRHFENAHRQFPVQPAILMDWAWLTFYQGRIPEAALILDRVEALIPQDPEPYQTRAEMAARLGDLREFEATRARARSMLSREYFDAYQAHVAKIQQLVVK